MSVTLFITYFLSLYLPDYIMLKLFMSWSTRNTLIFSSFFFSCFLNIERVHLLLEERDGWRGELCFHWQFLHNACYVHRHVARDTARAQANRRSPASLWTDCQAAETVSEVRGACQGRKRCDLLASEAVFGNPCAAGIKKYLAVTYACGKSSSFCYFICCNRVHGVCGVCVLNVWALDWIGWSMCLGEIINNFSCLTCPARLRPPACRA